MFRKVKLINDLGRSVTIAEDANDYVLDESGLDLGQVEAAHNMTQYIDLIGKHLDSTVLSPRDITIVGWIIGSSEAEIMKRKRFLNHVINPMYNMRLEIGKYALDVIPDNSIQYSTNYLQNNEYMCEFQIQATAPMPLFKLKNLNQYGETVELRSEFHWPFSIPKSKGIHFGYYPANSIAKLQNFGDVVAGFTVKFAAVDEVVNPVLYNLTTGTKIELNYSMSPGDTIEICTELGQQYVSITHNMEKFNGMKYVTADSDISMTMGIGMNNLAPDADSGRNDLVTTVQFSPRFLEVEGQEDDANIV